MQSVSLTLPLFLGGGLQLVNDLAFCLMFRHVRPPEEQKDPTLTVKTLNT